TTSCSCRSASGMRRLPIVQTASRASCRTPALRCCGGLSRNRAGSGPPPALPRLTGEVAEGRRGRVPAEVFLITDHESQLLPVAFPLRPLRGHLPRLTGEDVSS